MSKDSLKLYSYYRSSASYRVRIALHLKGLDFEYNAVHLLEDGGQQLKDTYKRLNPSAEVPTLTNGDKALGQSMAICLYLDDIYPDSPKLFSLDPFVKAKMIQACEVINSGIQPLQNLRVLKKLTSDFNFTDQQKKQWINHWATLGFEAFESIIQQTSGKFCFGDQPSAVDAFLIPQIFAAQRFEVDISKFSNIVKVEQNCLTVDAFQKAHPSQQPDTPTD